MSLSKFQSLGRMGGQLSSRVIPALAEDLGLIPSTFIRQHTTICNSSSGGIQHLGVPGTLALRCTYRYAYIHILENKNATSKTLTWKCAELHTSVRLSNRLWWLPFPAAKAAWGESSLCIIQMGQIDINDWPGLSNPQLIHNKSRSTQTLLDGASEKRTRSSAILRENTQFS